MAAEDIATPEEAKWGRPSAWAPLRDRTFRMLWLVWLTANICAWMNDTTAAWVMTTLTDSPTLVALVQTASSMPVFLLGLPSGAFADILDRRKYHQPQFQLVGHDRGIYGRQRCPDQQHPVGQPRRPCRPLTPSATSLRTSPGPGR